MAHTLPDYTTKYKLTTVFANIDNSELAARLGSVVTFDRRGNVIFIDDFEADTLKWKTGGAGTDNAVALDTTWAKTGNKSCKLTAGKGVGGQAYIYRYFGVPITGKIGLEHSFTLNASTSRVLTELRHFTGTKYYTGYIRYTLPDGTLEVYDGAAGFITIEDDYYLESANDTFHTLKLVVDTDTKKYIRLLINNTTWLLSDYSLKQENDNTKTSMYAAIVHTQDTAAAKSIWVDDVILTQNEP